MKQAEAHATSRRAYRLGKRQEDIEETRRRIIDAAVELHGTVGPVNTTFSAVAERAGVQRSTLYRHFADEAALFGACTSHWLAQHPWPRATDWRATPGATERLQVGLTELYAYYERNEAMIANSFRDIAVMPSFVGELMLAQLRAIREVLTEPFAEDARTKELEALLAFATDFRTARALAGAGFAPSAAANLLAELVVRRATGENA